MAPDLRSLRIPAYRRLFTGQAVTVVGSQLTVVAVQQQIFSLTQSSAMVGAASFVALIPLVVFGLLGGAIVDTYDRRKIMLVSSCGIAATSVGLWLNALSGGSVALVFALLAVQQGLFAVNSPARGAVIPRLVPAALVPGANALNMTVFSVGVLLGPLLAGVLLPISGLSWLYFVDALLLAAVIYAVFRLPAIPRSGPPGARRATVADGLRYLRGRDVLLLTFVVDLLAMVFGYPRALFPQLAQQTFGGPPEGGLALGLLSLGMGLGAAIAGLTGGWIARVDRQGAGVVVAIMCWGFAVIGFGFSTALPFAVFFLAVGGMADMVSSVYRSTILQLSATDEMRGRLQGVFLVIVAGGPRLADLVHGVVADWTSPRAAVIGGGVGVIVTVLAVTLLKPALVRYRASSPSVGERS